jgi:Uma2 family endonuclease
MVSAVLNLENGHSELDELLQPEPLSQGQTPESRVIVCGSSWNRYLAFDQKLGQDRSSPRLYFLEGDLESVTTSTEHERLRELIGDFLGDYFLENRINAFQRGQATLRHSSQEVAAEPDKSWCIGQEHEFPDLVLEIALTSGGIDKLEIYRLFKIPEVWIWRRNRLEVFVLEAAGHYVSSRKSRLLPELDISLVEKCAAMPNWTQARLAFRAGLKRA